MSIQKKYLKSKPVCKVTFTIPKEAKLQDSEIHLVGDFNNWEAGLSQMKRLKNGSHKIVVDLACDNEYQFRYLVDNEKWENDWSADKYAPSPYPDADNSVVVV